MLLNLRHLSKLIKKPDKREIIESLAYETGRDQGLIRDFPTFIKLNITHHI